MTVEDFEKMSSFSCGVPVLDDFFKLEAKNCVSRHYLAAYCAYLRTGEIVAAFTLMNDALMIGGTEEKTDFIDDLRDEIDGDAVDFLKRQTSYPAINIGHLATAQTYQCYGIGTKLIDLVVNTYSGYKQAGCQFVTVDALKNDGTLKFYLRNGFVFQTNRDFYSATRRMYRILV